MKVLIVTKDKDSKGGVANYFRIFFSKFSNSKILVERFAIGSKAIDYNRRQNRKFAYATELLHDLWRLSVQLRKSSSIKIVQVNPSFIPVPLIRDGLVILVAKIFRRKVLTFYRGWTDTTVHQLLNKWYLRHLFLLVYGRCTDHSLVLAHKFAEDLQRIGLPSTTISTTKTMFDGSLIQKRLDVRSKMMKLLFISRISAEKGCFEIIEALAILKKKHIGLTINLYGHGATSTVITKLNNLATKLDVISQCQFHGYVDGIDKFKAYASHDIFLLPSHHEGCPNSILEAMASGCFIISTDVGAISEVVEDGVNGKIIQAKNAQDLADKIEWAVNNKSIVKNARTLNKKYAFDHFESETIIKQMLTVYKRIHHHAK